jgi:LysM repeat protein
MQPNSPGSIEEIPKPQKQGPERQPIELPPQPGAQNNGQQSEPPTASKGGDHAPPAQQQPPQLSTPGKGGGQGRPAPQTNHNGLTFAPTVSEIFNFYDGSVFNPAGNSMSSGADRMAQAREINANIPSEIQSGFNDRSINYYHPGTGDFFYYRVCSGNGCAIVQVATSCNCYLSGFDQQLHYLTFDQGADLEGSTFNHNTRLPPATKYLVKSGDTLFAIAERYTVELSAILAANPDIQNADEIAVGQVIHIPAQGYKVAEGDYLDAIAKAYNTTLSAIVALNEQIENPGLIFPGQIIKVPAKRLGDPFCTTVEPGDSLYSIADKWGLTLSSVEAASPLIKDKNLIYPKQVVNVSMYLPVQGNLTSANSCPTCEMDDQTATALTGAKFAMATAAPKLFTTTVEVGPTATQLLQGRPLWLAPRELLRIIRGLVMVSRLADLFFKC